MNAFYEFQAALENTFSSLEQFSDLNWDTITQEYISVHESRPQDISDFVFGFPQFLQDKAQRNECPPYLFELAYFELLEMNLLNSEIVLPQSQGYHLNPTLSFLNLEFDISQMLSDASEGKVNIIERPHVLCFFHHPEDGIHQVDLETHHLKLLQRLEDRVISLNESIPEQDVDCFHELVDFGLILKIS